MHTTHTFIVATLAITGAVAAHAEPDFTPMAEESQASTNTGPPILSLPNEGGLAGAAEIGVSSAITTDLSHMIEAMSQYSRRYGPFSAPGMRGVYEPFPIYPVGAREWKDLIMNNYVDLDLNEGPVQDWNCGPYTYDGNYQDNGLLMSFDHQLIGVPVVAVLDGTVTDIRDDQPDQNSESSDALSNYIGIHHGGDRYCWYESLKQDSVIVEVGQEVRAGEQIAMAASSGSGNWPGLGFSTWVPTDNENVWGAVEPYVGECNSGQSGWVNQIDVPVGATCRDFGITTTDLNDFYSDEIYSWLPPTDGFITLDHDKLWMWTQSTDIGPFSTYQVVFFEPSGNLNYDTGTQWINFSPNTYRYLHTWFWYDLPGLHTTAGTWTVNVIVNGEPYINFPLEVVEPGNSLTNRPPQSIVASIGPSNATPDDMLTCSVYTAQVDDLDWDLVRFLYTWTVGGDVVRETVSAGLADHLPRLDGCDGAVVECRVVPSDGLVYGFPFTSKIRLAGAPSGDSNCDGSVDIKDLLIVLSEWGSCSICSGDHNQDGEVDVLDLLIVISAWG
jgi:hypothetical protein